jgi:glycine/D-amino acid oxidase-like deaminating enzyme
VGRPLRYRDLSLWHDTADDDWRPRPALPGDRTCDVAVVGAGLTGLWTAYYLLREDPSIRILLLESEVAGFGASGRNGGWCSALFPWEPHRLAGLPRGGRDGALAQLRAMRATVDEVGRVAQAEGIDAQFTKGGTVTLARNRAQVRRARDEVADARRWGLGEDRFRWLDRAQARDLVRAPDALGATYTPDCAALHPARLTRGLARTVERLGARIHERTPVRELRPGRAVTDHGTVYADIVLRATEGYTAQLPGHRRSLLPLASLVVATEPLDAATWDEVGLATRPTFADHRHLVVYGQRTADGRLVFGGRGAPYHFGSAARPGHRQDQAVWARLRETLVDLFPVLRGTRFSHAWGGVLGVPRDWCASVGLDRRTGLGWAGGYVGDGLSTTNLAGRTLRDLVLARRTPLTTLPWVQHRSPRWEPEPLRWAAVNGGLRATALADHEEGATGRPSRVAGLLAPLTGR